MNLNIKKLLAIHFQKRMTADCVLQTLNKAKNNYHIPDGMISHIYLDSQIYSGQTKKCLKTNKIKHFYSRKETPYDNAEIESFDISLKKVYLLLTHILKKQTKRYLATLRDFIIIIESIVRLL